MTAPVIPDHLLRFDRETWLARLTEHERGKDTGDSLAGPLLRANELLRREQETWCGEQGIDWTAFCLLRDAQIAKEQRLARRR